MKPALDLPAQVFLIAWTLRELPNKDAIAPILQRSLALAGVRDVAALRERKRRGKSVRGVSPVYPRGSVRDIARLRHDFESVIYREIEIPPTRPLATGTDWSYPVYEPD